jgi:hypothetical protein
MAKANKKNMAKPPVGLTLTGADADLSLLSFYFIFVPGGI